MQKIGAYPFAENRQCPRFKIKERAFVFSSSLPAFGEILDIGLRGISFRYLADEQNPAAGTRKISILAGSQGIYLDNLPVKPVADREEEPLPLATTATRIAGLRFGRLTAGQKAGLQLLISRNATPAR